MGWYKQADIKASSEIHKLAKEARFGKSPDTVIFNTNGNYSAEELNEMSVEQFEQLMLQEQSTEHNTLVTEDKVNTQVNT